MPKRIVKGVFKEALKRSPKGNSYLGPAEKLRALTNKDLQRVFICLSARFFKEIAEKPSSWP